MIVSCRISGPLEKAGLFFCIATGKYLQSALKNPRSMKVFLLD
jgi:hypothetical protein